MSGSAVTKFYDMIIDIYSLLGVLKGWKYYVKLFEVDKIKKFLIYLVQWKIQKLKWNWLIYELLRTR